MTVTQFIFQLQQYARSAPGNGMATVCIRSPEDETCFPEFNGLDFVGLDGKHAFVLAPINRGTFKTREIGKVN
jgi:hypothetical protein